MMWTREQARKLDQFEGELAAMSDQDEIEALQHTKGMAGHETTDLLAGELERRGLEG